MVQLSLSTELKSVSTLRKPVLGMPMSSSQQTAVFISCPPQRCGFKLPQVLQAQTSQLQATHARLLFIVASKQGWIASASTAAGASEGKLGGGQPRQHYGPLQPLEHGMISNLRLPEALRGVLGGAQHRQHHNLLPELVHASIGK